jgi:hypothetical protein
MILKPREPIDPNDRRATSGRDEAKGGYSIRALERLLDDCDEQPLWRDRADRACAYYDNIDNDQLTPEQKLAAMQAGIDPRSINLIGRVVNGVLGQEAKSRRDPMAEPDDDDYSDVADVLNVKLKEAKRETLADMECSAAYAHQVKAGAGFTEIRRNSDPLKYGYHVEHVPRDQLWWDWRSRKIDWSDARWVLRRQWKDLDEVIGAMPEHRQAIEQAMHSTAPWTDGPIEEDVGRYSADSMSTSTRFRTRAAEWRDGSRERICMYQIQYRVPATVVVMTLGHRKIIVDPQNPLHAEALSRGLGKVERVSTMQIRNALYAGPVRLLDEPTTQKRFIWVPWFAFRRDADDTPYGLIEGMMAPQDDYNEAAQRMRWMLKAQQLLVDSDAPDERFNTIADIAENMMRPDMVTVLNPNRKNANALTFRNDIQLQRELFERMQDSKQLVQDVPGIYGAQLGDAPQGVTSGIAMNTLVEQGIVAMGELNDNYMLSRRLTFENLMDLIVEDHLAPDMQVKIGVGATRRTVVLNTRNPETGEPMNVVKDAPVKLGLGEAPSSPAYQMQTATLVGNMISAMAGTPQAGMLIPHWVESNPMMGAGRKQLADDMRRSVGLPVSGDRQRAEAWQQQQEQAAAAQQQAVAQAQAAATAKAEAEAMEARARVDKIGSETLKNIADVSQITAANEDQLISDAIAQALSASEP